MNRLLMVDLDGTIRETLSGEKFIRHPHDQRIIEGADKAIAHYHQSGYQIIGITNQGGVAAGHKSLADCFEEQRYTLTLFPQMLQICACPDWEGKECWVINQVSPVPIPALDFGYEGADFRKPEPGMLKFAMWQYGVAPQDSFYIGDRQEDADAADAASVHFFWAETWLTRWNSPQYKPEP